MKVELQPKPTIKIILLIILVLLIGNLFTLYLQNVLHWSRRNPIVRILNFNTETSIPTVFSFLLLFFSSFLFYYISVSKKKHEKTYWKWLSFLFLFLAVDEAVSIHEMLGSPVKNIFDLTGFFHFAWIIPY